jgi:rRNA maturation protein Nop10
VEQELVVVISAAESEETELCPDCDSMLEEYYDGWGNLSKYCDNCGSQVYSNNPGRFDG